MEGINDFKRRLYSIHKKMQMLDGNIHSMEFDSFMSDLRILLSNNRDFLEDALLDAKVIPIQRDLQKFIANSFYLTEEKWAKKICADPFPKKALAKFPDYDEYLERTLFELSAPSKKTISKALFVGSGPVPITSIFLANKNIQVDCVDIQKEACDLAKILVSKLGLHTKFNFFNTDILDFYSFEQYDIIWVAVLVGENNLEKTNIVRHVCNYLNRNQFLILRTGYGPGKMLYPEVSKKDLAGCTYFISDKTPYSQNIQSIFVQKL